MIFAIRQLQTEPFQLQSCTDRQSCRMSAFLIIRVRNPHLVDTAEIVSARHIYIIGEQDIKSQYEVVDKLIIPVVQVYQRTRYSQRPVGQSFAGTYLQVERNSLVCIIVRLQLTAQILRHDRCREGPVFIIIIQSQVYTHGERIVSGNMRSNTFRSDTANQHIRQCISEIAGYGDVSGRESTHFHVVFRHFLDISIVDILCRSRPCSLVVDHLCERSTGQFHPLHICHVIQVHRLVADRRNESRVVEHQRRVVLDNRNIITTQSRRMGTHRQAKEVIIGLTLLCCNIYKKKKKKEEKNGFFHLFSLINRQRYLFFQIYSLSLLPNWANICTLFEFHCHLELI